MMKNEYQRLAGNTVKLGLRVILLGCIALVPLAAPVVALEALLLAVQAVFLTMQLRGWIFAQIVCIALLLILNTKPLLLAAKKLFGVRWKGATL